METPSRHTYNLDGSTRVFPVPSPIKGDNYCRLEVDGVIVNDRSKYDIVNNSIVFIDAADVPDGSQLDILVVQSEEAIGQLAITTNIDIVASNITDINTVGADIEAVNTNADNIVAIQNADANATAAATSASNAATSETNAAGSATAAASSATAAQVAKIEWQGDYSATTAYSLNDAVTYQGSSYICIQAGTGQTPAVGGTTYWNDLANKGDQGIQGVQGIQGDQGDQGIQGIQGVQGDTGLQGDQGIQGIQGVQGEVGPQGIQGIQGLAGEIQNADIGVTVQAYDADTAKTDVSQEFTATQNFNATTLTFDATQDWSLAANQVTTLTLTGNTTFDAPTGQVDGAFYHLTLKQNGTGGYTVAWNSVFKFPAGTAPTITTTASAIDELTFKSDGTNLHLVSLNQNLS